MHNSSSPLIETGKVYPFYGTGTPFYRPNSAVEKPADTLAVLARRVGEYATTAFSTATGASGGYTRLGGSTGTGQGGAAASAEGTSTGTGYSSAAAEGTSTATGVGSAPRHAAERDKTGGWGLGIFG